MDIKPIETVYNGYRFRSRLEARWAVFFDALGIRWQYEPEGYKLSTGEWYLPDFYLPSFGQGTWCEVKPHRGDFSTAIQFAKDISQSVWLCEGMPDFAIYKIAQYHPDYPDIMCGIPNAWDAYGEDRMFTQPCHISQYCQDKCGTPEWIFVGELEFKFEDNYTQAVYAARQARFEHGETPNI